MNKMARFALTFSLIFCLLPLQGCKILSKMSYKVEVSQGNAVTDKQLASLKKGMEEAKVLYLLGAPVLRKIDKENNNIYVYSLVYKEEVKELKIIHVHFEDGKYVKYTVEEVVKPEEEEPVHDDNDIKDTEKSNENNIV